MAVPLVVAVRADGDYDVELESKGSTYRYVVNVPADLVRSLGARVDPVELVEESFRFLLEREPAGSIMSSFGLEVISRYFPDYRSVIAERFA